MNDPKETAEYRFSKEELDWMASHLDETMDWARGERTIVWTLVVAFVAGLGVYVTGFAVAHGDLALPAGWPTDLVGDLLTSLGVALWTSVVIAVFLEVLPQAKRRQARAFAKAALQALHDRGGRVAAEIEAETIDPVEEKLDAILARLDRLQLPNPEPGEAEPTA
ncbi:MAG TPA: hypothetical protein VIC63_06975 [Candidatus Limnocylindria bacterium]|jgi:hypothetical protein